MFEKLEAKMDKRLGLKAVSKDNMKTGEITGYVINPENLSVEYLIYFTDSTLRKCHESNVVILKDSK